MDNRDEFVQEIEEIKEGVREALSEAKDIYHQTSSLCVSKETECLQRVDKLVTEYLPNLELETLKRLEIFESVHRLAIPIFDQARRIKVPLLKRIKGEGEKYKILKLQHKFDLLRGWLKKHLDSDKESHVCMPIRGLHFHISKLENDLSVQRVHILRLERILAHLGQIQLDPAGVTSILKAELTITLHNLRSIKSGKLRNTLTHSQFPNQVSFRPEAINLLINWALDVL